MIDSCGDRSHTPLGSSSFWGNTRLETGILSGDVDENPHYHGWNKVWIPYCDGTLNVGYNEEPYMTTSGSEVFFRGYNNTVTAFDYIIDELHMDTAEKVLLSGTSSGGIATVFWKDELRSLLNDEIQMWAVVDSGVFPIFDAEANKLKYSATEKLVFKDSELVMPRACPFKNIPGEVHKCIFIQLTASIADVNVPTLIV